MFLLNDRDLLSLKNKRKKKPQQQKQKKTQLEDCSPDWTSWMIKLRVSSHEHPGDLHSTRSSLSMSFLYCETSHQRQQHYRGGIISAEERRSDEVCQPSGHTPFCTALHHFVQPWVLLDSVARTGCWLRFGPAGLPGSASHPTLQSQELGPSRGQDLDFVLVECHMRFLHGQSSRQPCPPVYVSPPYDSVCPGREYGIRTWLRKQNSESCCSWFLGPE